ncbi:polyketide synthase, partial [bacterium]
MVDTKYTLEPIAIIGIGCRFPGAENVQTFWNNLKNGVDSIKDIPEDRWNKDEFYSEENGQIGKMNTKRGGFLERVDLFDADFFNISAEEADSMDPQQRLLLELSYEALEDSGQKI